MKKLSKNKKGFTLIELIVVVAILLALMLMLVPRLTGFVDDAKKTANQANARAVYTAIQASLTAKTTGISSGEYDVALCSADKNAYKKFWDSGDLETTVCTYVKATTDKSDYVTYGTGTTMGTYPVNTTPTPAAGN